MLDKQYHKGKLKNLNKIQFLEKCFKNIDLIVIILIWILLIMFYISEKIIKIIH